MKKGKGKEKNVKNENRNKRYEWMRRKKCEQGEAQLGEGKTGRN
jgi:hypothetical protein